ncbi:hypothetical protein OG689_42390 [Kitasatospora sp. NBC_00240]|uniref:hypothetical protein n=1 Tax=Kitasatospora sp. NBC_00240 TaxID=2903567 RepID=UPI00225BB584|nr:hypothetical protein [Kitasatospora sp. NBC_00240]MCX5215804.1 hypothetical protein [Kitasatospora sp. NBC_00240]
MVTNRDEEKTLRDLLRFLDRVAPLAERTATEWSGWTVHPRSALAGDDAKSTPFQLSHGARLALVVAVDHLQALRSSLIRERPGNRIEVPIHTHAQFTLIRAALENAARAVWLLGPTTRLDRVKRRLALQYADYLNGEKWSPLLGQSANPAAAGRRQQIDALLIAAGVPEAEVRRTRQGPTYKDIVRSAGELTPLGADRVHLFWSVCSSLAHGDLSGTLMTLDREITNTDGGIALAQLNGSVQAMSAMAKTALEMAGRGFDLYVVRAAAPY